MLCSLLKLAFHDADTDTDTDTDSPNTATILRSKHAISSRGLACVGRKIVAVFGESVSVSVSVSASWNASINQPQRPEYVALDLNERYRFLRCGTPSRFIGCES